MKTRLLISFLFISISVFSQKSFTNLNDLLEYASQKNIDIKTSDIRIAQAKKAKLAAIVSIIDPTNNSSFTFLDNTKLPVNVINGQELQFGTKYSTNFSLNTDIKLINLAGWENFKLAKTNIEVTNSNKQLTLKSIQESIAVTYYNIVSLKEQLKSTEKNLSVSDTLYQIASNKYKQGIVKQQDVNDTKVNVINAKETINQLKIMIDQHYVNLKILADIPEEEKIEIQEKLEPINSLSKKEILDNDINVNNSILKEQYALSSFKQIKKSNLPVVSFVMSQSNQLNNQNFKPLSGNWINSSYVGAKITIPMFSANTLSNNYKAKYDYEIAKQNTEQAKIKSELDKKQLSNDFDKALSQYQTNKEILSLRSDTYQKNKNLYKAGILGMDQTINSYNTMVNANYSMISSHVNVLLALSKIEINNKLK